ncbi:MAG: hypothetical protein FJZ47_22800 [Candidatus Tectomicrobia bacterium]|uniref:Chorismate dehydratase n=1 Tax=Tectimicrobiota bacterium TaxID=2528274 RepID=A0A938B6D9_UNCTE|nr:hypothetical protein [Candidatus Tectomicrobia bacterium]
MALRIGRVPYLHTEPFYVGMRRRDVTLCPLVASAIAGAAHKGEIDAAPVPLVHCPGLADTWQPVAGFCIASAQQAGSCLLHARQPISALSGVSIGIPDEAATAVRLLDVLLQRKYHIQPGPYVSPQAAPEALLLMGNEGLRQRRGGAGFAHTYDLGAEWHAWTGLPCVFARWMVRREVSTADRTKLEEMLYVGLEEGVNALCELAKPRQDLLMLPRDVVTYIQGFRYYIGRAEEQAIEQFQHYIQ